MDLEFLQAITNYGIPAIFAAYLLIKTTKAIEDLRDTISHQTQILQFIASRIAMHQQRSPAKKATSKPQKIIV